MTARARWVAPALALLVIGCGGGGGDKEGGPSTTPPGPRADTRRPTRRPRRPSGPGSTPSGTAKPYRPPPTSPCRRSCSTVPSPASAHPRAGAPVVRPALWGDAAAAVDVRGWTIARFRLIDRPGRHCDGVGNTASTAFAVRKGKIAMWIRVADDASAEKSAPRGRRTATSCATDASRAAVCPPTRSPHRRRDARPASVAVAAAVLAPSSAMALEDGLARTPPMGWNGWYAHGCKVSERTVRSTAGDHAHRDARGGYRYVNLDDCWMGWSATRAASCGPPRALPRRDPGAGELPPPPWPAAGHLPVRGAHDLRAPPGQRRPHGARRGHRGPVGVDLVKLDWCRPPLLRPAPRLHRDARRAPGDGPLDPHQHLQWRARPWTWGAGVGHMGRPTTSRATPRATAGGPCCAWPRATPSSACTPVPGAGTTRTSSRSASRA